MTVRGAEAVRRYLVDAKCGLALVVQCLLVNFPDGRRWRFLRRCENSGSFESIDTFVAHAV